MGDLSGKTIAVLAFFLLAAVFGGGWGCMSCTTIEPGHVGVSIKKCGGEGVSDKPIPTGYYFKSVWCEDVKEYPTSLQTIVLTDSEGEGHPELDQSITVTSKEGLPIKVDVSMSFTLEEAKVPGIYRKYRAEVLKIGQTFMRQTIREGLQLTFAKYSAEELYSDKKEIARAEVQDFLGKHLGPEGFVITQFTINEMRVPEAIKNAINNKVAMIQEAQRAEQEVKKKQAEANQAIAVAKGEGDAAKAKAEGDAAGILLRAEAQAKANRILSESITPALIQYETAKKWDGQLPQVSGGATPFINLQK